MNILVIGSENETDEFVEMLDSHEQFIFRKKSYTLVDDYDQFLTSLNNEQDIVFVLSNGAMGMESVIASKKLCPKAPVIWFSNDKDFGAQSYRLGTEYFATKPVTNEHITSVAQRIGIR